MSLASGTCFTTTALTTGQVVTVSEIPGISVQPTSKIAFYSNNVAFAAAVSGVEPLNYQWYFNDTPLTNSSRTAGANTTTLSISNLTFFDGGNYKLVVTNITGATTSAVAALTMAPSRTRAGRSFAS